MEVRPKLKRLSRKKLGLENVEIERAHIIGKEERDRPSQKRPIITKCFNYKNNEKVLRE